MLCGRYHQHGGCWTDTLSSSACGLVQLAWFEVFSAIKQRSIWCWTWDPCCSSGHGVSTRAIKSNGPVLTFGPSPIKSMTRLAAEISWLCILPLVPLVLWSPLWVIVWFSKTLLRRPLVPAEQCAVLLLHGVCFTKSEYSLRSNINSYPTWIFNWQSIWTSEKLTIFFLPRELQEIISAPGWLVLAGFIAFETISLVTPFRAANFDHFAHLGGYFMGIVGASAWKTERQKKLREEAPFLEKWLTPKWSLPSPSLSWNSLDHVLYSR